MKIYFTYNSYWIDRGTVQTIGLRETTVFREKGRPNGYSDMDWFIITQLGGGLIERQDDKLIYYIEPWWCVVYWDIKVHSAK